MSSCAVQGQLDFDSDPWPKISEPAKDCVRRMLEQVGVRPGSPLVGRGRPMSALFITTAAC